MQDIPMTLAAPAAPTSPLALNPAHDPAALAPAYAQHGRLQVRDILTDDAAAAIEADLRGMNWWLAFNDGATVHQLDPQQLAALTPQQAGQIQQTVYRNAVSNYQFLYNYYPLYSHYFRQGGAGHPLFRAYEFINSRAFLDFARVLTGLDGIRWADGHATLYRAGHFLKFHTDENPAERRLAAYVLNFTRDWGRDWGGLLQFWDAKYDVELAYRPIFNALNIFTVPADHSVSVVAPYAPGLRLSITGWLRADDPPGPIGRG